MLLYTQSLERFHRIYMVLYTQSVREVLLCRYMLYEQSEKEAFLCIYIYIYIYIYAGLCTQSVREVLLYIYIHIYMINTQYLCGYVPICSFLYITQHWSLPNLQPPLIGRLDSARDISQRINSLFLARSPNSSQTERHDESGQSDALPMIQIFYLRGDKSIWDAWHRGGGESNSG